MWKEKWTFSTSIDAGVIVRPGQIIEIADPVRSGERRGGRISAATFTDITVDDSNGLSFSVGSTLSVVLSDGSVENKPVSILGDVITVSSAFTMLLMSIVFGFIRQQTFKHLLGEF